MFFFKNEFILVATQYQSKIYWKRVISERDFKGLHETLRVLPWDLVTSDPGIDTSLEKFQDIPQRTLKRCSRPPWIDNKIMKLIRKKKKLWKCLKTNGSPDLFLKFKDLRRKTKKLINSNYQQYLHSLSENSKKIPSISGHSILLNLRQKEFQKLLFTETPGLETWILRWNHSMCFFNLSTLNQQLMSICWPQQLQSLKEF